MREPAYIALGPDGRVTLYWGDGTEARKHAVLRGPRPADGQELLDIIAKMKAWAEDNGYAVIVPAYDLEVPNIEINLLDQDVENIDLDEVDDLLDDLFAAGGYDDAADFPDDEPDDEP
ncbi:MAG: hypothetical protein JXJ20_04875 [Anaerolineae bacterium]|jgi:hypothetical protein|nr:hypothetical protein [Anaerolineae bacterium]